MQIADMVSGGAISECPDAHFCETTYDANYEGDEDIEGSRHRRGEERTEVRRSFGIMLSIFAV